MVMVDMLDVVPALLRFFPVPMGVNDQQGEHDDSTDQQHNDDWPVLPNVGEKTGEIVIHPSPIYTRFSHCQTLLANIALCMGLGAVGT